MHLFEELHDAVKKFGFKSNIVEDSFNNSISNLGLVYKSILLSILYKKKLEKEKIDISLNSQDPTFFSK